MIARRFRPAALLALLFAAPAFAQQEIEDETVADWTARPVAALSAPVAARTRLLSLARAGSRLVAVGHHGVIETSEDGLHWQQSVSPVSQMLTRVRFRDDRTGWAVGYDGVILKTVDSGLHWSVQHLDAASRPLYDILFLDAEHGIAVGGYGTYLTSADGGNNWTVQESPLTALGLHFNNLRRLDDGSLFLTGEKGLLAYSNDDAASWKMLKSPYAGSFFGALPLGGRSLMVYGMRGNVFVADNIGHCPLQDAATWDQYAAQSLEDPAQIAALGWRRLENPSKESLFGASRMNSGEILLVGINGTALQTQKGAGPLVPVQLDANETLVDLQNYKGRLIGVGKRGAQDLGEAR